MASHRLATPMEFAGRASSRSGARAGRLLVTIVAVTVVAVGVFGGWYFLVEDKSSPPAPTIRDDGPTFYQALAALNSSVSNQTGGPWSIFSVMGIAAEEPYSPSVKGYVAFNASLAVNGCQAALNGLTMFNGTIPPFNGTFNSGTAPFWQFAWYSNTTSQVLVGTDVLGVPRVFPSFSLQNNCTHGWGDFGLDPTRWVNQIYANGSLPADSTMAAQVVWNHVDTGYLDRHQPLAELYTSGPAMLAATQDLPSGILGVDFVSCGLAGFTGYGTGWPAGYGMAYYSGVNRNGSYAGHFNGTTNCFLGNTATVPGAVTGAYELVLSNATASSGSNTTRVNATSLVNFALTGGGLYTDTWGLANWMVGLNVTTPTDQGLPVAAPGCPHWVSSISGCQANASGWYAVLLSASGGWLASYGLTPGGQAGWSVPVTAMVSHQELVVIVPRAWSVAGDTLSVTSTTPYATVTGSIAL